MHEVTPLTNIICLFFKLFSNRGFFILDFRHDAAMSKISFGDPQPDPLDSHVFGPPGSIFRMNPVRIQLRICIINVCIRGTDPDPYKNVTDPHCSQNCKEIPYKLVTMKG
jgi:hypothetical protein